MFAKLSRLLSIFLIFVCSSHFCAAQDIKKAAPPQPDVQPPAMVFSPQQSPSAAPTIPQSDFEAPTSPPYEPLKFNIALWIGIGVGGVGSFLLFLILHRSGRVHRDWVWPILSALLIGYLLVIGVGSLFPTAYDKWSEKCLQSQYFDSERRYSESDEISVLCANAQVDHKAIGLNYAVNWTRQGVAGGLGNPLFLGEMKFVIWLMIALWSTAIYAILLFVRRRFFIR